MDYHELREKINQKIMAIEAPIPIIYSSVNKTVKSDNRDTPVRIYTPIKGKGNNFPIILLIHGGAWVAGNLDTHDNLARYLCSQVEAVIVSVEYVNAPEGKFPLQLQQCYDVLTWIIDHASEFLCDSSKLAVVGDSSGGNMAAALCLMVRDQHGPKIDLQVLINPALDLRCNGIIEKQNDELVTLRWQAAQYLLNPNDINNPYVSPLVANDLSNLPEAVVLLAENDDLREAGEKYAQRLKASGICTFVYTQKGIGHLAGYAAKASSQAIESLEVAVYALRNAFLMDKADLKQKNQRY
jgi:acetyl esterase